jgi:hypothetical protein
MHSQTKYSLSLKQVFSTVLLLVLIISADGMQAQNLINDIQQVYSNLKANKQLDMHAQVTVTNSGGLIPNGTKVEARIVRNNDWYYTDVNGRVFMINNKYIILKQPESKVIVVEKITKKPNLDQFTSQFDLNSFYTFLDSSLHNCDSVKYCGIVDGIKEYVIKRNDADAPEIHVYIDVQKTSISRFVYFLKQSTSKELTKIDVKYDAISFTLSDEAMANFKESNLIEVSKAQIKPVSKYAEYKVIMNN